MIAIAYYLLKVIVCSGVLFLYYHLFLRNKIFHQWNRFYLLASVVLSIVLPFIQIDLHQPEQGSSQEALNYLLLFQTTDHYLEEFVIEYNPGLTWEEWLMLGYALVSFLLFTALLVSVGKVLSILQKYKASSFQNIKVLSTKEPGSPFSFFHYIIWNEEISLQSPAGQQIFQHELVHVQQKHTLDKLFMQGVLVVLWSNPFFWLIRKELRFIHEFIADQKAVGSNTAAFAAMILQSVYPNQYQSIVNPFFQSSIKRRLHMLTQLNNPRVAYLSRIIALPLVATVAFTICARTSAQNAPKVKVQSSASKIDSSFNRSKQIELVDITKDPNEVEVHYQDGTVEKLSRQEANKKGIINENGYNNFKTNPAVPETSAKLRMLGMGEQPLFILDNKEVKKEVIEKLNPNDIESMKVLKGASATAVYGEKGKHGVIVITSKRILVEEMRPDVEEVNQLKNDGEKVDVNEIVVKGHKVDNKSTMGVLANGGKNEKQSLNEVVVKGHKLDEEALKKEVVVSGYRLSKDPIFEKAEFSASIDPAEWRRFLEKYSRPIIEEAGKSVPSGKYTVLVKFVVEKDGSLSDIQIVDDPGFGLGTRVAEMMKFAPKWKPAIQNEKVVRSYHTQPITFVINSGTTITKNKMGVNGSAKTIRQLLNAQDDDTILSFTLVKSGTNKNEVERLPLQGEDGMPSVQQFLGSLKAGDLFTVQQIIVNRNGVKTKLPAIVHHL